MSEFVTKRLNLSESEEASVTEQRMIPSEQRMLPSEQHMLPSEQCMLPSEPAKEH
jgi:hypothetical protein